MECHRCLVIYDGGPVPLLSNYYTPKLLFMNCAFRIATREAPSESGKQLIDNLLAPDNLANVKFGGDAEQAIHTPSRE